MRYPKSNRNAPGTSAAGRAALDWLDERGGDGVFADIGNQVLSARGEKAPVMRATWNELSRLGYVEFYGKRRARIVPGHKADPLRIAAAHATRSVHLS